jgi:hypothetical protein
VSAKKKLDAQTETQVVAMIARGDTQQQIVDWLKTTKDIELSPKTISLIKSRNAESLKFMQGELIRHEVTAAESLLDKSRKLIDRQLDDALHVEEKASKLRKQFDDGEITAQEFSTRIDNLIRSSHIPLKDLTAVAKETFNQSQIEQGKPTSIADNPAQAKANLATLLIAIKSRDDQATIKALFPDD